MECGYVVEQGNNMSRLSLRVREVRMEGSKGSSRGLGGGDDE